VGAMRFWRSVAVKIKVKILLIISLCEFLHARARTNIHTKIYNLYKESKIGNIEYLFLN